MTVSHLESEYTTPQIKCACLLRVLGTAILSSKENMGRETEKVESETFNIDFGGENVN